MLFLISIFYKVYSEDLRTAFIFWPLYQEQLMVTFIKSKTHTILVSKSFHCKKKKVFPFKT